jgi:protein subunit release factor B
MKQHLFSVTMDDCRLETFTAGGNGGQNQNRRNTGVRITHLASGAVGEARDSRSQLQNKKAAWTRMAKSPEFQKWIRRETAKYETGKTIEQEVTEQMLPHNLRVEVVADGKWVNEREVAQSG